VYNKSPFLVVDYISIHQSFIAFDHCDEEEKEDDLGFASKAIFGVVSVYIEPKSILSPTKRTFSFSFSTKALKSN
jgi:hypothetical protein